VIPRTKCGYVKFRPVRPGSRVALIAPASPFKREDLDAGVAELARLGLEAVYDEQLFERQAFTAGRPRVRTMSLLRALDGMGADAVIAMRGGYGSVELLELLDADRVLRARTALVGYSDLTTVHAWLGGTLGLASVHGAMIEGRIAAGPAKYDPETFLRKGSKCFSPARRGERWSGAR
jgi:muramoyltetrapeptide carboxypeptidase